MKNMIKNNGGYILPYVLVVVTVVSLIAVAACTTAIRNYKAQTQALSYSQDKYAAEGIMERYVVELQDAAIEVAEAVYADVHDKASDPVNGTDYVGSEAYVRQSLASGIESAGIVTEMTQDGCDIFVDGDMSGFQNYTYIVENPETKLEETRNDSDGYFAMTLAVSAYAGDVSLEADIRMLFEAKVQGSDDKRIYYISGVTFEYTSYDLTLASEGRTGR